MSLQNDIRSQVKDAMLKREAVRLGVLRGLLAAFTNELVAKGKKPDQELADEDVLTVIKRSVKQRKDSIEQFKAGNRDDLAESEAAELKILETFLPQMMSEADITKVAEAKKKELGVTDNSKLGVLVGAVMKELKGQADGATVKKVVESLF
ncbi:MAG: GatB/YqeY domain-containing protein [Candidatus Paceibacterota bacterium]|jgi:hypothetical protein